ncbi:cobaltochelatase CobT-related protein [Halomonas salipaludis]|uniref:VWFA domain-containing protein n=1 Tax=Halomonas salipaludis TaxID=2032625 RepID=A0A2A2EQU4_9GAMM|nr:hypothetical protein [Halomonas salipaludis]PAU74732.1 hypothetical protein CK498_21660 [Halomonas salipaludis]
MSQASIDPSRATELVAAWTRTYAAGHSSVKPLGAASPCNTFSRGEADALAAWRRWHDPDQDSAFSEQEWGWYALIERARVETLASRHLPGMASNLMHAELTAPDDSAMAALYRASRILLAGQSPHPPTILQAPPVQPVSRPAWLKKLLTPSTAGTRQGARLENLQDSDILHALAAASHHVENDRAFRESVTPIVKRLARYYADSHQPQLTLHGSSRHGSAEEDPDAELTATGRPHDARTLEDEQIERDDRQHGYAVYSRAWDEQQPASFWYRSDDAIALKQLDMPDRRRLRQLAHRLQRRLMAARLRHWSFDQDEGRLDSRRLARLIGDNPSQRVFRVEQQAPVPEACVTLLVDQSGSMRGERRRMAAIAIDLAVHTLELCKIRCEVLGFTTRFNADNPLAQQWQAAPGAEIPGRLNAVRHIIYKTPEQPWRRARQNLGLLLREELGHENIDGEALYWAAKRLIRQPQPRKVLIVLSDGAPYDKATAQANGREFLEQHLRRVIQEIDQSAITLAAIGTGQDVARFYRQALTVRRPEAVAESLFERLGDLLTHAVQDETRS